MINYVSIIRKAEFTDLFKYGQLYVSHAYPFDGALEDTRNEHLFSYLTSRMNNFDYSYEYVIIHFKKENYCGTSMVVSITDAEAVYALDDTALKMLSLSMDERIELKLSPWSRPFKQLKLNMMTSNSYKGVDNVWTIFALPGDAKATCAHVIKDEYVEEVLREIIDNRRPSGNLSPWVYLLRYERHAFYTHDIRGNFCDFIHVACNWKNHRELDSQKLATETEAYKMMKGNKLVGLAKSLKDSNLALQVNEATGCEFHVVAPLFLLLKGTFIEGLDCKKKIGNLTFDAYIDSCKKTFGDNFHLAAYLLGITLGYDRTYDCLYDTQRLKIFKSKESIAKPAPTTACNSQDNEKTEKADETNKNTDTTPAEAKTSVQEEVKQQPADDKQQPAAPADGQQPATQPGTTATPLSAAQPKVQAQTDDMAARRAALEAGGITYDGTNFTPQGEVNFSSTPASQGKQPAAQQASPTNDEKQVQATTPEQQESTPTSTSQGQQPAALQGDDEFKKLLDKAPTPEEVHFIPTSQGQFPAEQPEVPTNDTATKIAAVKSTMGKSTKTTSNDRDLFSGDPSFSKTPQQEAQKGTVLRLPTTPTTRRSSGGRKRGKKGETIIESKINNKQNENIQRPAENSDNAHTDGHH